MAPYIDSRYVVFVDDRGAACFSLFEFADCSEHVTLATDRQGALFSLNTPGDCQEFHGWEGAERMTKAQNMCECDTQPATKCRFSTHRDGCQCPCHALEAQLSFQRRVSDWMMETFSMEVTRDTTERNHRFLEEALELVQSLNCTREEAHMLVDYVFGRPIGAPEQEVGGVTVTLAALCNAADIDVIECGERELSRCWLNIDRIRAKHAGKPRSSPLPGPSSVTTTELFGSGRSSGGLG